MKQQEIRYYKQDYHPVIDYIKKAYFPNIEEISENYFKSIITKNGKIKGNGRMGEVYRFSMDLDKKTDFSLMLHIGIDKKVEDNYIVFVERVSVTITESKEDFTDNDFIRLTISDTGHLITNGTNAIPRATVYKEKIEQFLFGKYYLNKKLEGKMPAKNNIKRSKI